MPLQDIIAFVEKAKKQAWRDFKDRYGDGGQALVLMLARKHSGLTQTELATKLGLKPTVNISATIKRYQERLRTDTAEQKLASAAEEMINDTI